MNVGYFETDALSRIKLGFSFLSLLVPYLICALDQDWLGRFGAGGSWESWRQQQTGNNSNSGEVS